MNNQSCRRTLNGAAYPYSAFGFAVLKILQKPFILILILLAPFNLLAQAVTAIITDYNGFWKSSAATNNSSKPTNNHNLLAFTYNGVQYSTGVNDPLLYQKGENFSAADFWCLPVGNLTGTITTNTKIGVGAHFDGVDKGASNPPPENDIIRYLTDGIKGLNIGTCVANLPQGALFFSVHSINATEIGDGKPDIIVTQIADPSGDYFDRYEFTDENGKRIGNYKDIVFTSIIPVGKWVGDFYEASKNPMTLQSSFTQTERPFRLWAADLSEFGLNASNIHQIRNFKINLSGQSDVAFVGYNKNGMSIGVLPVKFSMFKGVAKQDDVHLAWHTGFEKENSHFVVERSSDGIHFSAIGTVKGSGTTNNTKGYTYIDKKPLTGISYYRIKQVDYTGAFAYSTVIQIKTGTVAQLQVYPNPGKGVFIVNHPPAAVAQRLLVYNAYGALLGYKEVAAGVHQSQIDLRHLPNATYYLLWQNGGATQSIQLSIQ